jgi:hypothetical protein
VAALNKFYRPLSYQEFMHEWGLNETRNAIRYAGFPEEVINDIWEPVNRKTNNSIVWTG